MSTPQGLHCLSTDQLKRLWPLFMWPNMKWLGCPLSSLCWGFLGLLCSRSSSPWPVWFLEVSPYFPWYSGLWGRWTGWKVLVKLELRLLTPEPGSLVFLPSALPKVWLLGCSEALSAYVTLALPKCSLFRTPFPALKWMRSSPLQNCSRTGPFKFSFFTITYSKK